jgi:hypothetical protein
MRRIVFVMLCLTAANGRAVQAQETNSVGISAVCKSGQVHLLASTYYSDPFCYHWATAPSGGCTQWKLFLNGQQIVGKYTVPATSSTQFPSTTPLDYYTLGHFPINQPGTYQIKAAYSRMICSGWWIFRTCNFNIYVDETPSIAISAADLNPATWANQCPVGTFDGANCFVMTKPPNGFIWNQGFYVPPVKNCPLGSFDGLACFVMKKPFMGFIWNNGFYTAPGPGNSCSLGTFDSANCFIAKAPPGTTAFQALGKFYYTPVLSCAQGTFDGANCLLAAAGVGTQPFEWNGGFYVTPRSPCQ